MGLHAVELTPATMAPMLPEGEEGDEDDNAEVVELSEGLQVLAGSSIGFVLMVNGGTISCDLPRCLSKFSTPQKPKPSNSAPPPKDAPFSASSASKCIGPRCPQDSARSKDNLHKMVKTARHL